VEDLVRLDSVLVYVVLVADVQIVVRMEIKAEEDQRNKNCHPKNWMPN
jgi:hypothetical protein